MTYSGVYAVLLVIHLATVVFVVGPLAVTAVTSPRAARAGDAAVLRSHVRTTRLYSMATLLTVLVGSAMISVGEVSEQWAFDQIWVSASLALWIVALALTTGMVLPGQRAALKAAESGGDPGAQAGRIAAGAGIAMLVWVVIIVLMVVKPGV